MILGLKITFIGGTHKIKRLIMYECDQCHQRYELKYQKKYLANRKYHLCSTRCVGDSRKKGGVACEYQLDQRNMIDWQNSLQNTLIERYGVENPSSLNWVKEKKKKTMLLHYGVENPLQSKEIRKKGEETSLKKYGVRHPSQSPVIQDKIKETSLERYGETNYSKTQEFMNLTTTCAKKYKTGYFNVLDKTLFFRSSYEERFLLQVKNNANLFKSIKSNLRFDYKFDDKEHAYFADFLLETQDNKRILIEVKPQDLKNHPVNVAKFDAVNEQLLQCEIDHFKIITECELEKFENKEVDFGTFICDAS